MDYKLLLQRAITDSITKNENIFELFTQKIDDHFSSLKSTTNDFSSSKILTFKELKTDVNRQKGFLFEQLTLDLILSNILLNYSKVQCAWRFPTLPDRYKKLLHILDRHGKVSKKDMGIDIVAYTETGKWLAIQCKYIKKPRRPRLIEKAGKNFYAPWIVPHKTLSTFYSLCATTGPKRGQWDRRIVITNCKGVNHQGEKEKGVDISICRGTFCKITREQWELLCGYEGHTLNEETGIKLSKEIPPEKSTKPPREIPPEKQELLNARNKWLDKLSSKKSPITPNEILAHFDCGTFEFDVKEHSQWLIGSRYEFTVAKEEDYVKFKPGHWILYDHYDHLWSMFAIHASTDLACSLEYLRETVDATSDYGMINKEGKELADKYMKEDVIEDGGQLEDHRINELYKDVDNAFINFGRGDLAYEVYVCKKGDVIIGWALLTEDVVNVLTGSI